MEDNNGAAPDAQASVTPENPTPSKVAMEIPKSEMSAATIGRMMGLATVSDLKLLDSKVDLLSTKVVGMTLKLDKILTILNGVPTGTDLERIDVQIGGLKTTIREVLDNLKSDS